MLIPYKKSKYFGFYRKIYEYVFFYFFLLEREIYLLVIHISFFVEIFIEIKILESKKKMKKRLVNTNFIKHLTATAKYDLFFFQMRNNRSVPHSRTIR